MTKLPEIPRYEKPIAIRHLIHHTSGLRDYLTLFSLAGLREDDYYTDDEVLEMLSRQKEPAPYAGTYFSDELQIAYALALDEERLL